jgi:predicted ATPase/DNA-binding CsgD family transcriptional regulator/Tfp pilus assembly protein PilF
MVSGSIERVPDNETTIMTDVSASSPASRDMLRGLDASRSQSTVTPILGREREIERLLDLLDGDTVRVLSLLGPGGVGKTRLALEVKRQAADAYAHGAGFVPLAAVREPALVPFAVAQSLGIQESGALPVPDLLAAWLGPRHFLLVLDNLEQVIDAASPWLSELVEACPRLKVLVTSRVALDIAGEQRFRVPPLPVPEAHATEPLDDYASVALFVQRARAIQPAFALDGTNSESIASICMRLDGLPLAIELAAARIVMFSPAEILDRLTDRLDLLSGNRRDVPARLRSLRDAIGWSYDLLPAPEQDAFRRLSMFVGGFTLEAAASTLGAASTRDTASLVANLIDQSLVESVQGVDGTRYRMLETIREYGLDRLAERGELDAARNAHAAYYQQLAVEAAEGLRGPEQAWWLQGLEDDYPNLREAIAWLTAQNRVADAVELFSNIWYLMLIHAHFTESRQLLDRWFTKPDLALPGRARALALLANGMVAINVNEADAGGIVHQLEEALRLFREEEDDRHTMLTLNVLAFALGASGDATRARQVIEGCMTMAGRTGDARNGALACNNLSWIALQEGDAHRAREALEEGLIIARHAGDLWVIAMALGNLGHLALVADGNRERALELTREALHIQEELGDKRNLPVTFSVLASIARDNGDVDIATAHLRATVTIAQDTGQVVNEGIGHLDLGSLALLQMDLERARLELREATRLLQPMHLLPDIADCLRAFAALAQASGDAPLAVRFLSVSDALLCGAERPQGMYWAISAFPNLQDQIRDTLGKGAFDRIYAEAGSWATEEALAAALAFELPIGSGDSAVAREPGHGLSPRELEVLRLMANGLSNQQIADALFLSRRTVTSHVTGILGKLDVDSRTAAVSRAIRGGIA